MKKKVKWSVFGAVVLTVLLSWTYGALGNERSFVQVGDQIIVGQAEEPDGPVRKPIVNRQTISKLDLSESQVAQIETIEKTLFEKYPDYSTTLKAMADLEIALETEKEKIEGWGRFKKELEEALLDVLSEEQLTALHPGKGKNNAVKPRGKAKVHLDRLVDVELTPEQSKNIQAIFDQFDAKQAGLGAILKMEMEVKPRIRTLEKSIESAEDEYASLVLSILTPEQISQLPMSGPPEKENNPGHVRNKKD